MLGLLLGTGAALLLDKSGGVIYSDREIRRFTRLPVLGRIPHYTFSDLSDNDVSMSGSLQYVGASIREKDGTDRNGNGKKGTDRRGFRKDRAKREEKLKVPMLAIPFLRHSDLSIPIFA